MSEAIVQGDERLWRLAEAYVGGELSAAESAELERTLEADAEAMRFFVSYLDVEAELAWPRRAAGASGAAANAVKPMRWRPALVSAGLAAAAVAIAGVVGWLYVVAMRPADAPPVPTRPAVAVLTDSNDVQWLSEPRAAGDDLPAGELSIATGWVELEFRGGASVMLVGPATLDLRTGGRATLSRGDLIARVPHHAAGFTIDGPGGLRVTDLGTEFAIAVSDAGVTRVHVLDGAVELAIGDRVEAMIAGDGYEVSSSGELTAESFRVDGLRRVSVPHAELKAPTIVGSPSVFAREPERYAAGRLLDDQVEGVGADWAGNGPGPHAMTLDFGGDVWLRGLRWAHRVDSGNPPVDVARRLELAFSDDEAFDERDATLSVEPDAASGVQTILFPAHRARFVRITVVGVEPGAANPGGSLLRWLGERIDSVESNPDAAPVVPDRAKEQTKKTPEESTSQGDLP